MSAVKRRVFATTTILVMAFSPLLVSAQSASAFPKGDSVIAFDYNIVATAHVKKADITISIGGGKFKGEVDFDLARLKGSISLPPVSFMFTEQGIGLVTATAAMVQTKPVTGKINLNNFKVTATSTFNMRILTMYATPQLPPVTLPISLPIPLPPITLPPLPLPKVNLVGDNCTTETPISVTMSGIAKIGAKSTFSGQFTIPNFKTCGLATAVLNQQVPGPGNSFSATASP